MALQEKCSSVWRRKDQRFPGSWTRLPRPCYSPFNTVCHYEFSVTNSAIRDLNPAAGLATPKSADAKSLMDYLFRWLELRFLKGEQGIVFELSNGKQPQMEVSHSTKALSDIVNLGDAPTCNFRGSLMVRNGSCYRCLECGSKSGCS